MSSTFFSLYPQYWPKIPPLCLPPAPTLAPGEEAKAEVYCGIFLLLRSLENAGRSFYERYEVRDFQINQDSSDTNTASEEPSEQVDDSPETPSSRWHRGPSMGWLKTALEGENLYDILEVEPTASMNVIKKQYRLLAVKYHPDKIVKDTKSKSTQDQHFLKIQESYEILSNDKFRKMYDSALPFDESIPDATIITDDESFFSKFSPVFKRNSQWSVKRPVPFLGDIGTPIAQVQKFYTFWFHFETNRDFSIHDEFDLNEAENREERRWMERENKKIHRKYLKAENQRIQQLVSLAYSHDPRIIKDTQQKEEQKKAEREKKLAKKRQTILEEEQRKDELRRKQEEEKRIEEFNYKQRAEQKKIEKQIFSKRKQRVRHLFDPIAHLISSYDLQCICTEVSSGQLQGLCDRVYKIYELDINSEKNEDLKTNLEHIQKKGTEETPVFSDEFKQNLLNIFHSHLQEKTGSKCKDAEVVSKQTKTSTSEESKNVENQKVELSTHTQVQSNSRPTAEWTPNELTLLSKAIQKFPGGTINRWETIAKFIGTKTTQEAIEKSKEVSFNYNKKAPAKNSIDTNTAKPKEDEKSPISTPNPKVPNGIPNLDLSESSWTAEQQKALEHALKKYPPTLQVTKRWQCIASEIPGKTSTDCINRCKQIRSLLQNGLVK